MLSVLFHVAMVAITGGWWLVVLLVWGLLKFIKS